MNHNHSGKENQGTGLLQGKETAPLQFVLSDCSSLTMRLPYLLFFTGIPFPAGA